MKIQFTENDPNHIVEMLQEKLASRELGKLVSFELRGGDLDVTIRKLGTSSLHFSKTKKASGVEWELTSEKIAFAHKAFKGEVLEKIEKVVNQIGGKVLA